MASYSDKLIEHYSNPRNVGSFDKGEDGVGTGIVGAPECGDVMKLQLKISDDGVVEDARFKTFGCGSAIASSTASMSSARCGPASSRALGTVPSSANAR